MDALMGIGLSEESARIWERAGQSLPNERGVVETHPSRRAAEIVIDQAARIVGRGVPAGSLDLLAAAASERWTGGSLPRQVLHEAAWLSKVEHGDRTLMMWGQAIPTGLFGRLGWCPVAEFAAYLCDGWFISAGTQNASLGLRADDAGRIAKQVGGTEQVTSAWLNVAPVVHWDPSAMAAWARSTRWDVIDAAVVRAWHEVLGADAVVLHDAGVSVDEYVADPAAYRDEVALSTLAALRSSVL